MQKNSILKRTIMVFAMSLFMAGATSMNAEAKTNIKVTAPSGNTVKVAKGKKVKLKTKVTKLKNKKVAYKSANPRVVKVTANGIVKGVKAGKTRITVTSNADKSVKKTIKVIVYKKSVKKIKLSVLNKTLEVNQQFNLNATVFPKKNASKVVKFSSSNKKVAKVTKKGLVKAVGIGSAKIVVKSTDGSKKKSVCKINVVNADDSKGKVGIKSLNIRYANDLDVELTKAKALNPEDFKIYYKVLPTDKYIKECEVDEVHTQDNIHYEVVTNNGLIYATTVKVEINSLSGVKSKEILVDKGFPQVDYYGSDENNLYSGNVHNKYIFGNVGMYVTYDPFGDLPTFEFSYPIEITVSNLPKGIKEDRSADIFGERFRIYGNVSEKLNGHKTVITVNDSRGRTFYFNVYFYVGDDTTVYSKACDMTLLAYKKDDQINDIISPNVYMTDKETGESDFESYRSGSDYKATGLPENTYIADDGSICVDDYNKSIKPGVYNITITGKSKHNNEFNINFKLTLIEGVYISGKVTDANGNPDGSCEIILSSNHDADGYYLLRRFVADENGDYKIRLIPGIYNVWSKEFYNSFQNDFTKSQTYNIKSNYYKVELTNTLFNSEFNGFASINSIGVYTFYNNSDSVIDAKCFYRKNFNKSDDTYTVEYYAYLKKGRKYRIESDYSYNIRVGSTYYAVVEKIFEYKGEKSISVDMSILDL